MLEVFINKTILTALVAASQLLLTQPATAVTFSFSWESDAPGLTFNFGEGTHTATGTVDINVERGESFTTSNVSNINITVTNGTDTIMFDDSLLVNWSGMVNTELVNGRLTASTSNILFSSTSSLAQFGCLFPECDVTDVQHDLSLSYRDLILPTQINADTQENLQASFQLTEVPFGIPNHLPIGF